MSDGHAMRVQWYCECGVMWAVYLRSQEARYKDRNDTSTDIQIFHGMHILSTGYFWTDSETSRHLSWMFKLINDWCETKEYCSIPVGTRVEVT